MKFQSFRKFWLSAIICSSLRVTLRILFPDLSVQPVKYDIIKINKFTEKERQEKKGTGL